MRAISTIERDLRRSEDAIDKVTEEEWKALDRHRAARLKAAERRGWKRERCSCHPHGLDSYRASMALENGGDPGWETCDRCGGNTYYWRSPKGRTALYPGGPFTG